MAELPHVIVGLGNPGHEYRAHRHNVGFRTVEALAGRFDWPWTVNRHFALAEGRESGRSVVLIKPLTYMNRSGPALAGWAEQAGVTLSGMPDSVPGPDHEEEISTENPVVAVQPLIVCDDLNLPLGSVRLRARGRSGGQNGLASVIDSLGGGEFPRLRLGVAPLGRTVDPADWADFVLRDFTEEETDVAAEMISHGAEALGCWLGDGLEAAVSFFNRRIRPETEPED